VVRASLCRVIRSGNSRISNRLGRRRALDYPAPDMDGPPAEQVRRRPWVKLVSLL